MTKVLVLLSNVRKSWRILPCDHLYSVSTPTGIPELILAPTTQRQCKPQIKGHTTDCPQLSPTGHKLERVPQSHQCAMIHRNNLQNSEEIAFMIAVIFQIKGATQEESKEVRARAGRTLSVGDLTPALGNHSPSFSRPISHKVSGFRAHPVVSLHKDEGLEDGAYDSSISSSLPALSGQTAHRPNPPIQVTCPILKLPRGPRESPP